MARFILELQDSTGTRRETYVTDDVRPALMGVPLREGAAIGFRGGRWTVTHRANEVIDTWVLTRVGPAADSVP